MLTPNVALANLFTSFFFGFWCALGDCGQHALLSEGPLSEDPRGRAQRAQRVCGN